MRGLGGKALVSSFLSLSPSSPSSSLSPSRRHPLAADHRPRQDGRGRGRDVRRDYALGAEERGVGEEEADPLGHAARAASHTPPPLPRLAIPPSLPWEPGPGGALGFGAARSVGWK